MAIKKHSSSKAGGDEDTDTRSYAQPHGGKGDGGPPHRPYEKMPHERDETAHPPGERTDQDTPSSDGKIAQAAEDVKKGLVDTDRRGIPDDVPGAK